MSSRLPKHLFDALKAARLAREFIGELSLDAYAANTLVRSAVERQLEIVGEACQRMLKVEPSLRDRVPELGVAIGLRNRIIHAYDRVEHAIVWDTVVKDLPSLIAHLQAELDRHGPPSPAA